MPGQRQFGQIPQLCQKYCRLLSLYFGITFDNSDNRGTPCISFTCPHLNMADLQAQKGENVERISAVEGAA